MEAKYSIKAIHNDNSVFAFILFDDEEEARGHKNSLVQAFMNIFYK